MASSSSSSSPSSSRVLKLRCKDKQIFEVPENAAVLSETIKHLVEDDCADDVIPVENVDGKTLSKIIEWSRMHAADDNDKEKLKAWDAEFLDVDTDVLYDLILAANYLNNKVLLDQICEKAASLMRGKQPEEIRAIFNIVNDFTPEEEEAVRKENAWAFE